MAIVLTKFANAGNPNYTAPPGPKALGSALDQNFNDCVLLDFSNIVFSYDPPYANLTAFLAALSAAGFSVSPGMRYYDQTLQTPRIYGSDGAWHGFLLT